MTSHRLDLILLQGCYAVVRLDHNAPIPSWATSGHIFSVTRTNDELSIVCLEEKVPDESICEKGWRCFRIAGQIPFLNVGVLTSVAEPLARAAISLFAISTFDTDYFLVKAVDLQRAIEALRTFGHTIRPEEADRIVGEGEPLT